MGNGCFLVPYRLSLTGLQWALATVPMQAEAVLVGNVTNVESVTATTDGDNFTLYFAVDAVVLNVNRTNIGYAPDGDGVKFEAYARDRSIEESELFVGPSPSPKRLEDGCCEPVYLNPPLDSPDTLTPAVYEQSFQEYTRRNSVSEPATSASLVSDPMSGGSKEGYYATFAQLFSMIIVVEISLA